MLGLIGGALGGAGEALEKWGLQDQAQQGRMDLARLQDEMETRRQQTLAQLQSSLRKDEDTHRTNENIRQAQATPYTISEGGTRVDPSDPAKTFTAPKTPTPARDLTPEERDYYTEGARARRSEADLRDAQRDALNSGRTTTGGNPNGRQGATPSFDRQAFSAMNGVIDKHAAAMKDDPSFDRGTVPQRKALGAELLKTGIDPDTAASRALEAPIPSKARARTMAEADYKNAPTGFFGSSLKDGTSKEDYLKEREAFHFRAQQQEFNAWRQQEGLGGMQQASAPAPSAPGADPKPAAYTRPDGSVWEMVNGQITMTKPPKAAETKPEPAPQSEERPAPSAQERQDISARRVLGRRSGGGDDEQRGIIDRARATDERGVIQQQFDADVSRMSPLEVAQKYDSRRKYLSRDQIARLNQIIQGL